MGKEAVLKDPIDDAVACLPGSKRTHPMSNVNLLRWHPSRISSIKSSQEERD
jgi:hypothetical protein